jgi:hypothetical protein
MYMLLAEKKQLLYKISIVPIYQRIIMYGFLVSLIYFENNVLFTIGLVLSRYLLDYFYDPSMSAFDHGELKKQFLLEEMKFYSANLDKFLTRCISSIVLTYVDDIDATFTKFRIYQESVEMCTFAQEASTAYMKKW